MTKLVNKIGEGDRLTSNVVTDRLYVAVTQEAEKHNANLVVLGTHGASGVKAATIGSSSELIDSLPIDTLVVDPRG